MVKETKEYGTIVDINNNGQRDQKEKVKKTKEFGSK
jgi:hypothetical protein